MARRFNEEEREYIKDKLMTAGREWFGKFGLKKTSVEELTKAVGIAQGSFYIFYGSKEELYFEIMEQEEARIRKAMEEKLNNNGPMTKLKLREFLGEAFRAADESVFVKQMHEDGVLEMVLRKLPKEKLEQNFTGDKDALLPSILKWQEQGLIVKANPETLVSMIRALFTLTLHRKEIGEHQFDATLQLMLDVIVEGLVSMANS